MKLSLPAGRQGVELTMTVKRTAMPLLNSPYTPGHALDAALAIEDPDERAIALAEYHYFTGHALEAAQLSEPYLMHEDVALRVSACWIYGYANLSLGDIKKSKRSLGIITEAFKALDENSDKRERALVCSISAGATVLLHLPVPPELPGSKQFLPLLRDGMRLFALYIRAHRAYLDGRYGESIGIAETALELEEEYYPIATVYLHLVATMDYMALKQPERAKAHLLRAWSIAQPDDLIQPFGEHHGLLGGMLEAVLKREYPADFKRIIGITYTFSAGWRRVHNPATGHDVADDLTTTEFAVAMLAARDWTNKEISAHLGISTNTVKHYLGNAFSKLGISKRDDLQQFMLK